MKPADTVPISPNALTVLRRRYLVRDAAGRLSETPAQMPRRVALNVAQAERIYDPRANVRKTAGDFYRLTARLEFIPNSPDRRPRSISGCSPRSKNIPTMRFRRRSTSPRRPPSSRSERLSSSLTVKAVKGSPSTGAEAGINRHSPGPASSTADSLLKDALICLKV